MQKRGKTQIVYSGEMKNAGKVENVAMLKVHKIEIFFGFDFEICIISLIVIRNFKILQKKFFDQAIIGGDAIFPLSLRLSGIEFSLV